MQHPAPAPAVPTAPPLLSVNNIEVVYSDVILVLRGLSLAVPKGRITALLGANGAGKSTTIKMLIGILAPTSGSVRTCGLVPLRQRRDLARRVGVVFGQRTQLWWDLPLADSSTGWSWGRS